MNNNNSSSNEPVLHLLPDYIKEDLDMVVIGLNPSLTSAQIGHYFAGPGNHFWSCISEVGLVPEPVTCYDDARMLDYSIGFTNACSRATKGAADLSKKELKDGMKLLLAKLQRFCPKIVVFNGKGTYETFVRHKHFGMGKQPNRLEGTNSVVFVMPSSSARCAQLPRAADKIPFFSALKDLRDKIKSWSGGLSSGGRLVPLEEVNGNIFPDHVDLELTRLYDAGKSNYSTDRAEKKRKANALNGGNHATNRSNTDDNSRNSQNLTSQTALGLQTNYFDCRSSDKQKPAHSPRIKEERLPNIPNHNFFMSGQTLAPNNNQWVPGAFYNSSFSYQPYIIDSSQYSSSQQPCRFPITPIFKPNILPTSLPPSLSNVRNYSTASNHNSLSSSDERTENSFDTSSFSSENMQLHNSTDSSDKNDCLKRNSKEEFDPQPQQSSTNFVSLLMSDSLSLPDSPCEFDRTIESRSSVQPISTCSWQNVDNNNQSSDPISCNAQNTFWEQNNNVIVSSYFSARRQLPQELPMSSIFSNFQGNNANFNDINSDNQYQTSFSISSFYSPPHSINGATNSISSIQSPLSSDQVTSSLCSVKVTPDSTSLANRKRYCFDISDADNLPNKLMIPDDNNSTNGHDQVTYTDL